MTTTDTPRTDACPHCGDKIQDDTFYRYECGTLQQFPSGTKRTELCHQTEVSNLWRKRAEKAEAEVERLQKIAGEAVAGLVVVTYGEPAIDFEWPDMMKRASQLRNELDVLKATLNQDKK